MSMRRYSGRARPNYGRYLHTAAKVGYQMYKYRKPISDAWSSYLKPSNSTATANPTSSAPPLRAKPAKKRRVPKKKQSKIAKCEKAIRTLKQETDASLGTMTYRSRNSFQLLSSKRYQNALNVSLIPVSELETVLTELKFFNPSVPGTLTTASGVAGTYQRNVLFKSITQSATIRNNYQTDCKVKVYKVSVKDDTNQSPTDAWTAGITKGSNLTAITDVNQYPTDFDDFNDLWATKVVLNTTLSPGQSATFSHTEKNIEYDPASYDLHSLNYQKSYRSGGFLVVVEGTLGHEELGTDCGTISAGVDVMVSKVFKVRYNAGVNIKYVVAYDNTPVLDALVVQCHQPVADNIPYSQG